MPNQDILYQAYGSYGWLQLPAYQCGAFDQFVANW